MTQRSDTSATTSSVNNNDSNFVDFNRAVYVPDARRGYVLGHLVDIGSDELRVDVGNGRIVEAPHDQVLAADEDARDVDDSCALLYLNEGSLLDNCRKRYARGQIYTYVANILISINPYTPIPSLYSLDTIAAYEGKSLGALPPHVFAIADKTHRELIRHRQSQSVVVSGESGAGKTETQKHILRYLCDRFGASSGPIESRLLEANPILEAFGNAKTLRNNNSSRFGKFVEIHFNAANSVAGGYVSHYLLEKSRICQQSPLERNYHVFYQLIAGADAKLADELELRSPDQFRYLRSGCMQFFASGSSTSLIDSSRVVPTSNLTGQKFLTDTIVDDYANFQALCRALSKIGFTEDRLRQLLCTVAGILHLGNIDFVVSDATQGGSVISSESKNSVVAAARLLGLEPDELARCLTHRLMSSRAGAKGTVIHVPLKPHAAAAARDALAKAIYSRLFDSIVSDVNSCIPFNESTGYIGVLDIAGFEFFEVNSFEQFCINYCNEKLQQFFNHRILRHEQDLYAREGLNVPDIEFTDNADCIEVFEAKAKGLLDLLDEESRLPAPSTRHYAEAVHEAYHSHFRVDMPRKSRIKQHRDMRDDEGFIIRHYAGSVCYQTEHFIEKNNDALHKSLEALMEQSTNAQLAKLFDLALADDSSVSSTPSSRPNKLGFISVGAKFRTQLNVLLSKLESTGTNFVRCIKPNSTMASGVFEGAQILSQLKCAGMGSVLRLMHCGFPSRTSFADLYATYQNLLPDGLKKLDPRLFCKCLFYALGLAERDFQFGLTKAFFRAGKFAEFDQLMHRDPAHMNALVVKVQSWLRRMRWKKYQYTVLSCNRVNRLIKERHQQMARAQAILRGYRVRIRVLPKLALLRRLASIALRLNEARGLVDDVAAGRQQELIDKVAVLQAAIDATVAEVKADPMSPDNKLLSGKTAEVEATFEALVTDLKESVVAAENARLEAIEVEKQRQAEVARREEQARLDQERLLAEVRAAEAERLLLQQELEKAAAEAEARLAAEQAAFEEAEKLAEQERLDNELTLRISNDAADANETPLKTSATAKSSETSSTPLKPSQNEFSKYTHSELRKILNTTNDEDKLRACRYEFHRRLRCFNGWRSKNTVVSNKNTTRQCRAATMYMKLPSATKNALSQYAIRQPKYFRAPIEKRKRLAPGESYSKGFWFTHWEDDFIVRELEIVPNRAPILRVAGRDDIQMCRMLLSETELSKDHEIPKHEFDSMWHRYRKSPVHHTMLSDEAKKARVN